MNETTWVELEPEQVRRHRALISVTWQGVYVTKPLRHRIEPLVNRPLRMKLNVSSQAVLMERDPSGQYEFCYDRHKHGRELRLRPRQSAAKHLLAAFGCDEKTGKLVFRVLDGPNGPPDVLLRLVYRRKEKVAG